MSSNRADLKKSQQEMFQFLQSDFRNSSKHDDVIRCLNASRMTKTLYCDSEKCENNICVSRNISLSQKINVINRLQDDPCDTTEFSATIKCSSNACSVYHSMLSENVNSNCNCDVMHCQQHKQISQSYMSSIYNLWRIRENRNLPLVTKKVGTQWKNCFWRIFLIPFIILLLCTTICNADPNQCAVGLKTPGSKFLIKAFLVFNKKPYICICKFKQLVVVNFVFLKYL